MKNILFIILITLLSCTQSEDNPIPLVSNNQSPESESLEGLWLLETINGNPLTDVDPNMVDIIWNFQSNGKYVGDYALECYLGCDSAYYIYSDYNIESNGYLKFVMYADSYGPGTDSPEFFTIISITPTVLEVYNNDYANTPEVYHLVRL